MKLSKTNVLYLTAILILQVNLSAQSTIITKIDWHKKSEDTEKSFDTYTFSGAHFLDNTGIPYYSNQIKVKSYGNATISILDYKTEVTDIDHENTIPATPSIISQVIQAKSSSNIVYTFTPYIKNTRTGKVERITEIKFSYTHHPTISATRNGPEFKASSILKDGDIYKVAVSTSGMYKITHADLTEMGISPNNIDPKKVQIFGNPNGSNPEANIDFFHDDLLENSIFIQGEGDGSFDQNDFILFYAHGPHSWNKDGYRHNIYDDRNYYFIKIGSEDGKRLTERSNINSPEYSNTFDTYKRFEKDQYNLLSDFASTQGSGQLWFSEKYSSNRSQDFSSFFGDANLDASSEVSFKIQFASRSRNSSKVNLIVNNQVNTISFNGVNTSSIESTYADLENRTFNLQLTSTTPTILLDFPNSISESTGWLDYIHMDYRATLKYDGEATTFRDFSSENEDIHGFQVQSTEDGLEIWDITLPDNIKRQEHSNLKFGYNNSQGIHEFVVFNPSAVQNKVEFVEEVENQNLHSITNAHSAIIYHPDFQEAAEKLALHRANHSDLNVIAVSVNQIYNEFSSGKIDVPGIRNFVRMLYQRDPNFNFLTLLGDGSFDYKHIEKDFGNESFIPVYETQQSMNPIRSFPTDDFYALLNDQEGDDLKGGLDIAVGRIPVKTADQAMDMVEKIINYDTNEETLADWRLRIGFASDDEDNNVHVRDADGIAETTRNRFSNFNVEKIYFDAYPQVSTPGGERYPQATTALNNNIFKGMLTLCYLGHGGPTGWAQERVLKLDDIENWDNKNKLPLLITATCSFTGYDNPKVTSAGELVFLKENTGAIALMSTVRAVYVNQNERLTRAVFDTIFTRDTGEYMGLGEILRRAKNSNAADTIDINARKFQLIGDPTLKLALPQFNIITDKINEVTIDGNYSADTIKALQKMSFEGYIAGLDGQILSDFNGTVNASVFDKVIQAKTLQNNTSSKERLFNVQKTVLFKGQSEVVNGRFRFEFYLPADINFTYGKGKISLYAKSGAIDAAGHFDNFIIGGSDESNKDDNPPLVDVYLNDEDFAFGGLSTPDPVLLVKLQDDFGINVSGVSVGHDLVAELDDNDNERYILNDFYEAELNDYKRGTVRFPLKDIEPGKHTIKIKAWDLSNNLGEGYTEFIVTDDLGESLKHVFNYPNPFSSRTSFMFEHNLPGTDLEILINIYNMSGQIVKTIEHVTIDDGFRIDDIEWNGRDDYDQLIANGVYLYKIKVTANQLGISKESNFEKLVILK